MVEWYEMEVPGRCDVVAYLRHGLGIWLKWQQLQQQRQRQLMQHCAAVAAVGVAVGKYSASSVSC